MATLTESIETAIVELLRTKIAAVLPASIRGVVDARWAINISLVEPPAILVEYAGEAPIPQAGEGASRLAIGGNQYRTDFDFNVFVFATSFTNDGAGRLDTEETFQSPGAYSLVDNVFVALAGGRLQLADQAGNTIQMSPRGTSLYGVTESHVIYKTRWHCPVTRIGAAVVA